MLLTAVVAAASGVDDDVDYMLNSGFVKKIWLHFRWPFI